MISGYLFLKYAQISSTNSQYGPAVLPYFSQSFMHSGQWQKYSPAWPLSLRSINSRAWPPRYSFLTMVSKFPISVLRSSAFEKHA